MDLNLIKLLAAIAILLTASIAGYLPFHRKMKSATGYDFSRGEALACGIFLGAGLIHMLGDANSGFHQQGFHYPLAFLIAGISFLVLLLMEHWGTEISAHEGKDARSLAWLAFIMLSIHAFVSGIALGTSVLLGTTLLMLVAILAHKWAAGFSLAVQLNKTNQRLRHNVVLFSLFAIMTPLGILLGDGIASLPHHDGFIEPLFQAIAAGTFLYIGTLHGLKRSVMVERCCNLKDFSFVIIGFVLMALVAL